MRRSRSTFWLEGRGIVGPGGGGAENDNQLFSLIEVMRMWDSHAAIWTGKCPKVAGPDIPRSCCLHMVQPVKHIRHVLEKRAVSKIARLGTTSSAKYITPIHPSLGVSVTTLCFAAAERARQQCGNFDRFAHVSDPVG